MRVAPLILFLDIKMPGFDGIEVARRVAERCHIVFVTTCDARAVAAFELGAVDYVLKPFDNGRLALACKRPRERVKSEPAPMTRLLRELAEASRRASICARRSRRAARTST